MHIARVFPRKTIATPCDDLSFFGEPPRLFLKDIDEVHISVTYTYDIPKAEKLAYQWETLGVPVKMGGPATGHPGGEFIPGLYIKKGYTITSRGCANNCWFCSVPKREGPLRELPIRDGWDVLDDNLLACSENHIRAVFDMLKKQTHKPKFTGGFEAKLLRPWHVDLLRESKAQRVYFAYDTPDDLEPLVEAGKKMRGGGITRRSHVASCYILIGYEGDTFSAAEKRIKQTVEAGFYPFAMLYRDATGKTNKEWGRFQREWVRSKIVGAEMKKMEETDRRIEGGQ